MTCPCQFWRFVGEVLLGFVQTHFRNQNVTGPLLTHAPRPGVYCGVWCSVQSRCRCVCRVLYVSVHLKTSILPHVTGRAFAEHGRHGRWIRVSWQRPWAAGSAAVKVGRQNGAAIRPLLHRICVLRRRSKCKSDVRIVGHVLWLQLSCARGEVSEGPRRCSIGEMGVSEAGGNARIDLRKPLGWATNMQNRTTSCVAERDVTAARIWTMLFPVHGEGILACKFHILGRIHTVCFDTNFWAWSDNAMERGQIWQEWTRIGLNHFVWHLYGRGLPN